MAQAKTQGAQATEEILEVTPEMAMNWLHYAEERISNRFVNDARVKQLAREMATGRWIFNGAPITFNTNGVLLDGQHRLWALSEAGVTLPFIIIMNLPTEAIYVTDIGRQRTLSQFLKIRGERDCVALSGVIHAHHRWLTRENYNKLPPNLQPTIQELLATFDEHGDDLKAGIAASRTIRRKRLGPISVWGSLASVFAKLHDADAPDFLHRVGVGELMDINHPCMALRRLIEAKNVGRGRISQFDLAPLIIKAWNAYRKGQEVKQLSYRAGGALGPEPYPQPE